MSLIILTIQAEVLTIAIVIQVETTIVAVPLIVEEDTEVLIVIKNINK
jgi:hypothetical protein